MRVAIVGAGRVSGEHAKAYIACDAEIVAIVGRTKESAAHKAKELGLRCAVYSDFENILRNEKPEAVSLCSPPELHSSQTILAARHGVHIAIEKPVALNKKELFAMREAAEASGVKTIVGFVLRWNDLVQNIKRNYLPRVGNICYLETDYWHGSSHDKSHITHEYGTRKQPISAFLGGGCHAVDMARFLVGSDIIEVFALTLVTQKDNVQRTTSAIVKFENGLIGKISATDEIFMPYIFNIMVFGNDGSLRLNKFYSKDSFSKAVETIAGVVPDSGAVWHHPFYGMIKEFTDCIKTNTETSCNLKNSVNTHLVCFAAEKSARLGGRKVYLNK